MAPWRPYCDFVNEDPDVPAPILALPELAVAEIVKYLPREYLLDCRQVFPEWDDLLRNQISKDPSTVLHIDDSRAQNSRQLLEALQTLPLTVVPSTLILTLSRLEEWESHEIVQQICQLIADRKDKIKNIQIIGGLGGFALRTGVFLQLISGFKDTLLTLNIEAPPKDIVTFTSSSKYLKILQESAPLLPKLTEITFNFGNPQPFIKNPHADRSFFTFLFSLVGPSLKSVQIVKLYSRDSESDVVKALKTTGRLDQIKKLWMSELKSIAMQEICNSGVQLTELVIADSTDFSDRTERRKEFQRMLEKQSKSLKTLSVGPSRPNHQRFHRRILPLKFPRMEELASLTLDLGTDYENLAFATNFPKLKELEIRNIVCKNYPGRGWQTIFSASSNRLRPLPSLTKLTLDLTKFCYGDGECCTFLGELFPNVNSLTLKIGKKPKSKEFLRQVSVSWVGLKELNILLDAYNGIDVDEMIFGITAKWKKSVCGLLVKPPKSYSKTSILKLKDLEKLTLVDCWTATSVAKGNGKNEITKYSAHFGLCLMKSLKHLEINMDLLSTEDVTFLRGQLPNASVIISQ